MYIGYQGNPVGTRYKNNIFFNANYNSEIRFAHGLPSMVEMDNNNYSVSTSDSINFKISQTSVQHTLSQIQSVYNRELNSFIANPSFINASNNDYHLTPNSPCINTGGFLTKTTRAGSGTQIPFEDVIYFCDGFGIVGGDTIQLQGQAQRVVITNIDTINKVITVDQSITWSLGVGVAIGFDGIAPDVGAYEYPCSIGISEIAKDYIDIYPNPFHDKIILPKELINSNYEVVSLAGEVVKNSRIIKKEIDLSELPSGIYFIKIIVTTQQI